MTTSLRRTEPAEPPWHRRSPLWTHEAEIRRLRAEGYSLRQIVDRLDLGLSRSTLHRWLRRASAVAAARAAGESAPAATPAALGAADSTEAAADDAAALAVLADSGFVAPSPTRRP